MSLATAASLMVLQAHRLDEYLQTTFITLWPDRLELDLVLNPGVAVIPQVLPELDQNADGSISPPELDRYSARVLQSIAVELDGTSLPLKMAGREMSELELIRGGQGLIRIQLTAAFPRLPAGAHMLAYRNGHLTNLSVYLVNATQPQSHDIRITGQHRDPDQRSTQITFSCLEATP
ncbi:MAG: hypothetical protein U1G08_18315 [Verrucomicrobiota bacterium]